MAACDHANAVVIIHVDTYGCLCGACWSRWVRGDMDWPEQDGDES